MVNVESCFSDDDDGDPDDGNELGSGNFTPRSSSSLHNSAGFSSYQRKQNR